MSWELPSNDKCTDVVLLSLQAIYVSCRAQIKLTALFRPCLSCLFQKYTLDVSSANVLNNAIDTCGYSFFSFLHI